MAGDGDTEEFWSQQSQVVAFPGTAESLPYETSLIEDAAAVARRSGPVDDVHVIGVGTGRELGGTRRLLPSAHLHAWDVSGPMVEACRELVAQQGWGDVVVDQADVVELTAAAGPADLAILVNAVLCYVNTQERRVAAVSALHSVLRPGGALAIVVHQRNGRPDWAGYFALRALAVRFGLADGQAGDRRIRHDSRTMLFHHYTPGELRRLLAAGGFDEVHVRSLRSWARATGHRIPRRSPNPLLVVAVRRG